MEDRPAVTFDLWHTLVHLDPRAEGEYMHRMFDAATRVLESSDPEPGAPDLTPADLRGAFEREMRRAVSLSHEGTTVTPGEQLARAARACRRAPHPERYEEALDRLVASTRFHVAPGGLETVRQLREAGYRLGIVSNTVGEPGRFLRRMLAELGLAAPFDVLVFSDEEPWTKPAPEIFRAATDRLGSRAARTVHVGDGWADIEGARRAGLRAGVLYTGLHDYAPEYRNLNYAPPLDGVPTPYSIAHLEEAVPLLHELLPA
jgi:HAD superfamily hydrolase (TIGR01549 family)